MRFPSLQGASREAGLTLARFPLVLASGLAAAVLGSLLVGAYHASETLFASFIAATLAIPLLLALAVTGERAKSRRTAWVLQLLGLGALVAVALWWPHWTEAIRVRRYAQISIASHLAVAFLPFARGGEPNAFWQYNRSLFLRFATSALYSAVLFGGLALALVAIDQLFKVRVGERVYGRLWIWIAFAFNTWFFLGGVPRDLSALESRRDYPTQLKVFAQFILAPLVAVYLAILTVYLGRIVVTGQWPKGWIGYLVSSVAATGILSLLLVHPVREREENRWIATYSRWFYVAMLPSIGMLLTAIWKRIAQYGITEDRYFMAVLALWLAAIAITFIARRNADIRWIPITLFVLALATAFGPWDAYSVSRRSQTDHARRLLREAGVLVGRDLRPATRPVPFEVRRELSSTLVYLTATHGSGALRSVMGSFSSDDSVSATTGRIEGDKAARSAFAAMKRLGMDYVARWEREEPAFLTFSVNPQSDVTTIGGADYHVRLEGSLPDSMRIGRELWRLRADRAARVLELGNGAGAAVVFPLDTLAERAGAPGLERVLGGRPKLVMVAEGPFVRATLVPRYYQMVRRPEGLELQSLSGDLYLDLPDSSRSGAGRR